MKTLIYEKSPSGRCELLEKWSKPENEMPSYIDYAKAFLKERRGVNQNWLQIVTKRRSGCLVLELKLGEDGNLLCVRASNSRR